MNKLNICIDIDGTITEAYCWIDIANKYFDTNLRPENVTEYEIRKVLNIPRKDHLEFYDKHGEEIHARATIRKDAHDILHKLNLTHNIFYYVLIFIHIFRFYYICLYTTEIFRP